MEVEERPAPEPADQPHDFWLPNYDCGEECVHTLWGHHNEPPPDPALAYEYGHEMADRCSFSPSIRLADQARGQPREELGD